MRGGTGALVTLALLGCGEAREPEPPQSSAGDEVSAPRALRRMTAEVPLTAEVPRDERFQLIDSGQAPRIPARLRFQPGHKEAGVVLSMTSLSLVLDGYPVPSPPPLAVRMVMDMQVLSVALDGTAFVESKVRDAELALAGVPPELVAEGEAALADLIGWTGRFEITPLGDTPRVELDDIPGDSQEDFEGMAESMARSLSEIAMPLPSDPIGRGARWWYRDTVEMNGLHIARTVHVHVVEIDSQAAMIETEIELSTKDETIGIPGTAHTGRLDRFHGRGSGTQTLTWAHLAQEAEAEIEMSVRVSFIEGGVEHSMEQRDITRVASRQLCVSKNCSPP